MEEKNIVTTDILIVGGGPSGLSTAIATADLLKRKGLKKKIILIDKGNSIGSHILSGAIIRPEALKELLSVGEYDSLPFNTKVEDDYIVKLNKNGTEIKLPFHPPYMSNKGNYIASLGEICKYLASLAKEKGVEIYTGFSAKNIIFKDGEVTGIKTTDTGIDKNGKKQKNFQEGTIVEAKITILAEGSRGNLTKEVVDKLNLNSKANPQIYSLGIKELWEVKEGSIKEGSIYHTFGYPLQNREEFGGGFIYGLKDNKVALGLIVGLDYKDPSFDIQTCMQIFKHHPFVSKILKGGKIIEAGAKTLPEGGWNSIPRCYSDNLLIVGDGAGFLSTARLKGIHLSVYSGIYAAKTAVEALSKDDTSKNSLQKYEEFIDNSPIYKELYPTRNFRAVMQNGLIIGGIQTSIQLLTKGSCLFVPKVEKDSDTTMKITEFKESEKEDFKSRFLEKTEFDKDLYIDKPTMVYLSKTKHDEHQPVHLIVNNQELLNSSNIKLYDLPCESFCPAEVYELHTDRDGKKTLRIHAENCVHCKTCDIKAPNNVITWTTPYGGDGPDYNMM